MNWQELIATVSNEQQNILDQIWEYYLLNKSWIPVGAVYRRFRKDQVKSQLQALGGSIVFTSTNIGDRERFVLTLLGALLTRSGSRLPIMFLQYLDYVKTRLEEDIELTEVKGSDLAEHLKLDKHEARLFARGLQLSPFVDAGGVFSGDNWSVRLPPDADDLLSDIKIEEYFNLKVLASYDPTVPVEGNRRILYLDKKARQIFSKTNVFQLHPQGMQMNAVETYDVFLSYASSDSKEASYIYDHILEAGGKVFLSEKNLQAGDDFEEAIRNALHASNELWLLLSPNSLQSEWVISEWGAAWALKKRIIPILLSCTQSQAPDRIRRLHCINFDNCTDLIKKRFSHKNSQLSEQGGEPSQRGTRFTEALPTCPNCSTDRPVFMSPIPNDFIEIENATHECPECNFKRALA